MKSQHYSPTPTSAPLHLKNNNKKKLLMKIRMNDIFSLNGSDNKKQVTRQKKRDKIFIIQPIMCLQQRFIPL